jgi:TRAP-type uncharacterized transport system substrate-binding protein
MAETIRLSSMEGGGQWWKSITWAGEALTNAGADVDITRYGTGSNEPLMRVVDGVSDVGITLANAAAQAAKGLGFYKNGEALSIRGLARLVRPNQHYFNQVRADLGIRSFGEIADKKPKLDISMSEWTYPAGQITEVTLRHYGIELKRDIEAWGGSFQFSHPATTALVFQGKCNAIMWPDTIYGPSGIAPQLAPFVLLPLDEDIANILEREYCAPKVTIPAGTLRGQTEPCLSVTNPGFELIVNKDLPNDVAYRIAKALNESSARHWAAQDVFYSIRHAPETSAPLHPGAARYYKDQGVLR